MPMPVSTAIDFITGDSEMASRMRAHDWTATPLGPLETWPQSLKAVIRIMLTSRYAMWMGWGPQLTFFYNDAYAPTLGVKHERALGTPAAELWAEIWPAIGPLIRDVMRTGVASWNEDLLLFLERSGQPEETYHTFSYSPLADDSGAVVGMFCVVTEETVRVITERRMATLRDLAAALNAVNQEPDVLQAAAQQLGANLKDLPFTLTYLFDAQGAGQLVAATGIESGHALAPALVAPDVDGVWPVAAVASLGQSIVLSDLAARSAAIPVGAWERPPQAAILVPISMQGQARAAGVFIAGLNPYRPLDQDYEAFIELVANQIAAAIANARSFEQARQRAEALAQIDRAKTVFFSNVSHEFRTPLTLMLGPLEQALANPALPEPELERLRLVYRNGNRLLKLVNSLLDFSRIEAGRMQAHYMPTDLASFTADLASNFRSATEQAGLALVLDCAPLSEPVYVDRDMWEKVVLNLLSNAFKFTFAGEIRVAVREFAGSAQVVVSDTGTGIPADELPRMFERFHRIEGARGRSFEGSGIGLALVQELVRLHGGNIAVSSEHGRGTAFTIELPFGREHLPDEHVGGDLAADSSPVRSASYVQEALSWLSDAEPDPLVEPLPEPSDAAGAARPYILLADDNSDMRDYIRRLISTRYQCEAVADGMEAMAAIERRPPDLLLTDIMMPRMDGFALIRAIRATDELQELPIVALSARAGEEARIEGLVRGADDYLVKPFTASELLARIEVALTVARARHQANEALRESEVRFREMADHAPVMIWTTDQHGACTYLSRSWYEFTGQTPATGLGYGWLDATHPDDRATAEAIFSDATASRSAFSLEYRLRRYDGQYRWAIDAASPWINAQGEFVGYIGSVIDITERKQVEDAQRQLNEVLEARISEAIAAREQTELQLRHAQKLEAVGKLTGGVAHDFNNLLQVIAGNLELLGRDVIGNSRAEQHLQTARAGVARGAKLASQLLAFGRRQPLVPKTVNLGRLIRAMDDMLRRALGEGIEIETVIAGGLWNTLVDAGQLENALLNLAINARDAMQGHGKLTIEAGNAWLDDDYALRHAEVAAGQYVLLAVSDTGCGIAPDLLDKVFEPFFTTKPEGKGTGLGLSMVYGFVKQSGGHVKLYSEPGHGTTVKLYLPRTRQQEDLVREVDTRPVEQGTETVLVVEDDEDVRGTVVEMLSELGYRVLKARDADSALVIIESGVPIDILFTDVVMPGKLRSPELARKAQERLPKLAVLFTSGYTENAIVHGGKLDEGVELLSKPYTQEALARKIRQVLRQKQRKVKPEVARLPAQSSAGTAGARQILFVEDDELIRATVSELLEMHGYRVFTAGDGAQALALLRHQPIDILMTDLNLPGMSGLELITAARERLPHLAALLATGEESHLDIESAQVEVLRKPYDMHRLQQALETLWRSARK